MDIITRVVMLILILVFSVVGVSFPFLAAMWRDIDISSSSLFDLLQCFAVGLICGVAILHIYDDALRDLSTLTEFPVAGCVMLLGCFMMVALNRMITIVAARQNLSQSQTRSPNVCGVQQGMESLQIERALTPRERPMSEASSGSFHGHAHQRLILDPAVESGREVRIKAYLMEFAIAVHSVLVGMGMGVTEEDSLISLGVALCFHQLFEGIAVGNQGLHSGFAGKSRAFMIVLFSVACPLGGVFGIVIASSLETNSDQARWTLGALNAFAAGTLLEIGCVDLLPELFSHKHGTDEKIPLHVESCRLIALALGAFVMAVLAIWA